MKTSQQYKSKFEDYHPQQSINKLPKIINNYQ